MLLENTFTRVLLGAWSEIWGGVSCGEMGRLNSFGALVSRKYATQNAIYPLHQTRHNAKMEFGYARQSTFGYRSDLVCATLHPHCDTFLNVV